MTPAQVQKYVNHEVSMTLDSTDAFEGPEKLLELWFAPGESSLPEGMKSLRSIPRYAWVQILDQVQCKILSEVSTNEMDSYVLSESSLFVFDHKVILKTCGTTTLLIGLEPFRHAVQHYCGFPKARQPWKVFYSHKDFMFPSRQKGPHTSWEDEVKFLDDHFENGKAYIVGNIKHDHWYLYATREPKLRGDEFDVLPINTKDHEDETLEIFMTKLSPVHANQFQSGRPVPSSTDEAPTLVKEDEMAVDPQRSSPVGAPADDDDPGHELGNIMTQTTGIDKIYPTSKQIVDAFSFAPCGYSCNGVVSQGNYFTIHVTPEDECSYASFETNVCAKQFNLSNSDVIERVINIFRPGRFSATYFASEAVFNERLPSEIHGYSLTDKIIYHLDGYELVFVTFEAIKSLK